ncbi:hypothetical protein ABW20_dc0100357 [Dactylellina cionopaga]|nr:hypothetical protein ABW20_dc0100357 [Dactylellina cionopaga]
MAKPMKFGDPDVLKNLNPEGFKKHQNAPWSLPYPRTVDKERFETLQTVLETKKDFEAALSSNEEGDDLDKAIIAYWKALNEKTISVDSVDIFEHYTSIPDTQIAALYLPVLLRPGKHNTAIPVNDVASPNLDIYAYRQYREMRLSLKTQTYPKISQFAVYTSMAIEMGIPTRSDDLNALAGNLRGLRGADEAGFVDKPERAVQLGVLERMIRGSHGISKTPREFILTNSQELLKKTPEELALKWEDYFCHIHDTQSKIRWGEIRDKCNKDPSDWGSLRTQLKSFKNILTDIEVAFVLRKDGGKSTPATEPSNAKGPAQAQKPPQTKEQPKERNGAKSKEANGANHQHNGPNVTFDGEQQILDFGDPETDGDERVEAYMKTTGRFSSGYIALVARGSPECCIHRVERRPDVDTENSMELKLEYRLAVTRGRKGFKRHISGIAFADKLSEGPTAIDPHSVKGGTGKPKRYPTTYIKIKWEDRITWETRSDVRRMPLTKGELGFLKTKMGDTFGVAKQADRWDQFIYHCAKLLEQKHTENQGSDGFSDHSNFAVKQEDEPENLQGDHAFKSSRGGAGATEKPQFPSSDFTFHPSGGEPGNSKKDSKESDGSRNKRRRMKDFEEVDDDMRETSE